LHLAGELLGLAGRHAHLTHLRRRGILLQLIGLAGLVFTAKQARGDLA
jgi:hypothetical protein